MRSDDDVKLEENPTSLLRRLTQTNNDERRLKKVRSISAAGTVSFTNVLPQRMTTTITIWYRPVAGETIRPLVFTAQCYAMHPWY